LKVLLSCVNTAVSLIGFDLDAGTGFWFSPADRLRACGACLTDEALFIAADDTLTKISATGGITGVNLPGPHRNLAHSVHVVPDMGIAVADTGNSRVLLYGFDLSGGISFDPLEGWPQMPEDALHLNDAIWTPHGIVASCFNYRPFRSVQIEGWSWRDKGYGLIVSLDKYRGRNVGKILACGLDCPHSLLWYKDKVWCCSSATGDLVRLAFTGNGHLREEERIHITNDYFLRGVMPLEGGSLLLGGSALRRQDSKGMALLRLMPDGTVHEYPVARTGEIYDILPWRSSMMRAICPQITALPPVLGDEDQEYPPPCILPEGF
jgi:hypothetical protein